MCSKTLRLFTCLLWMTFLFSVCRSQSCNKLQRDLAANGTCNSEPSNRLPCRDPCTGRLIVGESNCTSAAHCCYEDGKCFSKNSTSPAQTIDLDVIGRSFMAEFSSGPGGKDTISGRNLQIGPDPRLLAVLSGTDPSALCPKFPQSCGQIRYNSPADLQPALNIPYCQRIPCVAENPLLEFDVTACLTTPGCAFDYELYLYRSVLSQAILPGAPICHLAIRNQAFQQRTAEYVTQNGNWNPLLTECLVNEYRNEILSDSPGCSMVNVLEELGYRPKRAGWKGISTRDCYLINGCWRTNGICVYPFPQSNIKVRSSHDGDEDNFEFVKHGRPLCLPFDTSVVDGEFLDSYHACLSTGCAADVDGETILKHLHGVATSLPMLLQNQFWTMALLGEARADNWKVIVDSLLSSTLNQYSSILPNQLSPEILRRDLVPGMNKSVITVPFSITVNSSGQASLLNSFNTFGSFGRFGTLPESTANLLPRSLNTDGTGLNPTNLNLGNFGSLKSSAGVSSLLGLQNLLSGISASPPSRIVSRSSISSVPCPYQNIRWFNFPPLRGSFEGCCEESLCYLPRISLRSELSGITSYKSVWSSWGPCSATCGHATRTRRRHCIGEKCEQPEEQVHACEQAACPTFSQWSDFSKCSASCGGGTRSRTRSCLKGLLCSGSTEETEPCKTGACPRFLTIGLWTPCSATCGVGNERRLKRCVSGGAYGCPKPQYEERECETYCGGVRSKIGRCNLANCVQKIVPICLQRDGTPGHCRPNLMINKTKRCYEGRCRCFYFPSNC